MLLQLPAIYKIHSVWQIILIYLIISGQYFLFLKQYCFCQKWFLFHVYFLFGLFLVCCHFRAVMFLENKILIKLFINPCFPPSFYSKINAHLVCIMHSKNMIAWCTLNVNYNIGCNVYINKTRLDYYNNPCLAVKAGISYLF